MASHSLLTSLSSISLISSKTQLNFCKSSGLLLGPIFVNIKKLVSVQSMGSSPPSQNPDKTQESGQSGYSSLSEEEWKKQLTPEQFYVSHKKGTERAFTWEYWNTNTPGTYLCVCCDTPFSSKSSTKFDSGNGWPSYYQPIGNNVKSKMDLSIIFMPRTEVVCAVCDSHLGQVFDDGPPTTGKRYCIYSASLKLKPGDSA